jgi:hypothetical protein
MMSIHAINCFTARWDATNQHLQAPVRTTLSKVVHVAWDAFCILTVIPALVRYTTEWIVNHSILPAQLVSQEQVAKIRKQFHTFWNGPAAPPSFTVERATVTTPDGVKLSAVWVKHKDATQDTPTVIHFNGNASPGLHRPLPWYIAEADRQDVICNFALFDYRGVGDSTGAFQRMEDLLIDGSSIVQWVREGLGTPADKIHFDGFSLGGAVATATQALDPNHLTGRNVNHCSFSSLDRVVRSLFGGTLGKIIAFIVRWQGYSLDVAAAWRRLQGDRLVVYHPEDRVIPMAASLQEAVRHTKDLCLKTILGMEAKSRRYLHHGAPFECYLRAREQMGQFLLGLSPVLQEQLA